MVEGQRAQVNQVTVLLNRRYDGLVSQPHAFFRGVPFAFVFASGFASMSLACGGSPPAASSTPTQPIAAGDAKGAGHAPPAPPHHVHGEKRGPSTLDPTSGTYNVRAEVISDTCKEPHAPLAPQVLSVPIEVSDEQRVTAKLPLLGPGPVEAYPRAPQRTEMDLARGAAIESTEYAGGCKNGVMNRHVTVAKAEPSHMIVVHIAEYKDLSTCENPPKHPMFSACRTETRVYYDIAETCAALCAPGRTEAAPSAFVDCRCGRR